MKDTAQKQEIIVQSPGRINIIGEHTDYNDGFVFPGAVDRKITVRMKRNGSKNTANITSLDEVGTLTIDLDNVKPQDSGWENYVLGVVGELQKLGVTIEGFDAEFEGDVPIGGGMSSSAALECSFAYALNELFNLGLETSQMIKASQKAEHNYVGIKCGIMDQFASMMGKKNQVMMLDCRDLSYKYYPLDLGDYQLLLLNTNVSHALASSEYNTRRAECEEGVAIIKRDYPDIINLRDVSIEQLNNYEDKMPSTIFRRCHHVVTENDRVIQASKAMTDGNHQLLGELVYQSHFSLQNDFEVSCPELDYLVQQTLDKDYVLGARMMGGGFGGCTINIVKKTETATFIKEVAQDYKARFEIDLTPISVSIEDGTKEVS